MGMETELKDVFDNVNSWLTFAETKNAGLAAFNGVVVSALIGVLDGTRPCSIAVHTAFLLLGILLFGLGLVASLWAFWPQQKVPQSLRNPDKRSGMHVVFYGDIAAYSTPDRYLEAFTSSQKQDKGPSGLQRDYAEQIIVNSRIAIRKYRCFRIGLRLTLAAILAVAIALGAHLLG